MTLWRSCFCPTAPIILNGSAHSDVSCCSCPVCQFRLLFEVMASVSAILSLFLKSPSFTPCRAVKTIKCLCINIHVAIIEWVHTVLVKSLHTLVKIMYIKAVFTSSCFYSSHFSVNLNERKNTTLSQKNIHQVGFKSEFIMGLLKMWPNLPAKNIYTLAWTNQFR